MEKWLEKAIEKANDELKNEERNLVQNLSSTETGAFVGVEKIKPTKIIQNGIATIVFWNDSTKTVVKLADDDENDLYNAFCAAFAKKMFGSNSTVKKQIEQTYKPSKEEASKEEENSFFEIIKKLDKYFSSFGSKYD